MKRLPMYEFAMVLTHLKRNWTYLFETKPENHCRGPQSLLAIQNLVWQKSLPGNLRSRRRMAALDYRPVEKGTILSQRDSSAFSPRCD